MKQQTSTFVLERARLRDGSLCMLPEKLDTLPENAVIEALDVTVRANVTIHKANIYAHCDEAGVDIEDIQATFDSKPFELTKAETTSIGEVFTERACEGDE